MVKNKQKGFLELIFAVVVAMLLLRYYGLTITGIWNWLENLFWSIW